jgi:hypothetical protein
VKAILPRQRKWNKGILWLAIYIHKIRLKNCGTMP